MTKGLSNAITTEYQINMMSRFRTTRKESDSDSGISSICDEGVDDLHQSIDDTLRQPEIPSKIKQQKIIAQVEYYFSDEYLAKDAYFLRQIRRKKEGYLSMKLITNFKKLRKMVRDVRVTTYCLRQSNLLHVNEEGTKVKRKVPISEPLQRITTSHRTVTVRNIFPENASIETLTKHFVIYGELVSVRIVKSDKMILCGMDNERIMHAHYGVIEFEASSSAQSACTDTFYTVKLMSDEDAVNCKCEKTSLSQSYEMWIRSLTPSKTECNISEDDMLINDVFNHVLSQTASITL